MSPNQFVGSWRLLSTEVNAASGEVTYPFGQDATGSLIYTQDGHMAVAIMNGNRPNFASPDMRGTAQEKLAAFDSYLSYFGTYEVKVDRVIHHVDLCLFPNWSGGDQERFFEFSGDRLTLRTPPMMMEGVERTAQLIWQRVPPRDATIQ
jgi:hypothetical protein